jgi:hypothetical protein
MSMVTTSSKGMLTFLIGHTFDFAYVALIASISILLLSCSLRGGSGGGHYGLSRGSLSIGGRHEIRRSGDRADIEKVRSWTTKFEWFCSYTQKTIFRGQICDARSMSNSSRRAWGEEYSFARVDKYAVELILMRRNAETDTACHLTIVQDHTVFQRQPKAATGLSFAVLVVAWLGTADPRHAG